jgi:hypothetical protein
MEETNWERIRCGNVIKMESKQRGFDGLAGFYEHCNETLGFIKDGEFLDQVTDS